MDDDERQKVQNFLIQVQSSLYDSGAAYTNLISLGGYAGAFAIWSFVKADLSLRATLLIAILLGISLVAFVGWNVHQMIWIALQRFKYSAKLQGLSGQDFINKYQQLEEATKTAAFGWLMRMWIVVLIIAISTALLAFLLLFFNCAAVFLGYTGWP